MASKHPTVPDSIKRDIRAVLISKQGGVAQSRFERDYVNLLGYPFSWKRLGFRSLADCIMSIPDVARLEWCNSDSTYHLFGIADRESFMSSAAKKAQGRFMDDDLDDKKFVPNMKGWYSLCFPIEKARSEKEVRSHFGGFGKIEEVATTKRYWFVRYFREGEAKAAYARLGSAFEINIPEEKLRTPPKNSQKQKETFNTSTTNRDRYHSTRDKVPGRGLEIGQGHDRNEDNKRRNHRVGRGRQTTRNSSESILNEMRVSRNFRESSIKSIQDELSIYKTSQESGASQRMHTTGAGGVSMQESRANYLPERPTSEINAMKRMQLDTTTGIGRGAPIVKAAESFSAQMAMAKKEVSVVVKVTISGSLGSLSKAHLNAKLNQYGIASDKVVYGQEGEVFANLEMRNISSACPVVDYINTINIPGTRLRATMDFIDTKTHTESLSDITKLWSIFIGGIHADAAKEELDAILEPYNLLDLHIKRRGLEDGFAFAKCSDKETMIGIVKKLNGTMLRGRMLNVSPDLKDHLSVFVTGIQFTEEEFKKLMLPYNSFLIKYNKKSESKIFAHVYFLNDADALRVIMDLDNYTYKGQIMRLRLSRKYPDEPCITVQQTPASNSANHNMETCPSIRGNFTALITHVDEEYNLLWGQIGNLTEDLKRLQAITQQLQVTCRAGSRGISSGVKKCVALFDAEWYRADVLEESTSGETKTYKLFYMDYGNTAIVSDELVQVADESIFKLRPMAIPFRLNSSSAMASADLKALEMKLIDLHVEQKKCDYYLVSFKKQTSQQALSTH